MKTITRIFCRIVNGLAWLGDKFFGEKTEEEAVLCNCNKTPFEALTFFETAPLIDGSWTMFYVAKCLNCGGYDGFPRENFLRAVQEGTEETLNSLRKAGVDVERVRLVMKYNLENL